MRIPASGSMRPQTKTKKLSRQQAKIVALLADREWHLNSELNDICFRYGGRIYELRALGYDIEGEVISKGLWRYRLVETPQRAALKAHLERTAAVVAGAQERLAL